MSLSLLQVGLWAEAGFAGFMAAVYLGVVQGRMRNWLARAERRPDPGPSPYRRRQVATGDKFLAVLYWIILAFLVTVSWAALPFFGLVLTAGTEAALFVLLVSRARYAERLRRAETAEVLRNSGRSNAPEQEN